MSFSFLYVFAAACAASGAAPASIDVEPVWAGHPVAFCLYTHKDRQFAAYYDAERRMTVAARALDSVRWHTVKLPERVVWDSHNYVTLAIDEAGHLHLSGNMHVVPLVYFRTRKPLDIDTFERAAMVGDREDRCTYPQFINGPQGKLIFTYRDGRSGSGDQIYNVYDTGSQTWRRLLDTPLASGLGKMNAYFDGPHLGPDGLFHLIWVWRDTFACETNHDLSYARSADLVHWETASGQPLAPPITPGPDAVVDPVPSGGGILNGGARLGFDSRKRPVIAYHKFDDAGLTQLYAARLQSGAWDIRQLSRWDYRWAFNGGGCIEREIVVKPMRIRGRGKFEQPFWHVKYGAGSLVVDEDSLRPLKEIKAKSNKTRKPSGDRAGMQTHQAIDRGAGPDPKTRYILQWETLGPNRDRPREGPVPPPSMLRVRRIPATEGNTPGF